MSTERRNYSANFKAKVALEAIQERETIEVLSKKHNVHSNQILRWKKDGKEEFLKTSFSSENRKKKDKDEKLIDELYRQIGQLKVDNE